MKQVVKVWNKSIFGEINLKVKEAESLVLTLQDNLDAGSSDSFHIDLLKPKALLHDRLKQKDTHWSQKSRIRWLQEGDKNSKFFHDYAKARSFKSH